MRYHLQSPQLPTIACPVCDGTGCSNCSQHGTISPFTPTVGDHVLLAHAHEPDDPVGLITSIDHTNGLWVEFAYPWDRWCQPSELILVEPDLTSFERRHLASTLNYHPAAT